MRPSILRRFRNVLAGTLMRLNQRRRQKHVLPSTRKKLPILVTNLNVLDYAKASSPHLNWYVNKTDLPETILRRVTGTQIKSTNLCHPSDDTKYLSETNQLKTRQRSFSWCLNETDFFETYQRTSWYQLVWSLPLTTGICYLFNLLKIKMVHSIYSSCYLIWFHLVAVTGFLASNVFSKSLE